MTQAEAFGGPRRVAHEAGHFLGALTAEGKYDSEYGQLRLSPLIFIGDPNDVCYRLTAWVQWFERSCFSLGSFGLTTRAGLLLPGEAALRKVKSQIWAAPRKFSSPLDGYWATFYAKRFGHQSKEGGASAGCQSFASYRYRRAEAAIIHGISVIPVFRRVRCTA